MPIGRVEHVPKIVIANNLADGSVVFLQADGQWSGDIGAGAIANSAVEADSLLEQANTAALANIVVDPYLIEVEVDANSSTKPRPSDYREYIRAYGPSVAIPS
jgi:hypothetical protein